MLGQRSARAAPSSASRALTSSRAWRTAARRDAVPCAAAMSPPVIGRGSLSDDGAPAARAASSCASRASAACSSGDDLLEADDGQVAIGAALGRDRLLVVARHLGA
jgi:hypothetical protein